MIEVADRGLSADGSGRVRATRSARCALSAHRTLPPTGFGSLIRGLDTPKRSRLLIRNYVISGGGQTLVVAGAQVDASTAYPLAPGRRAVARGSVASRPGFVRHRRSRRMLTLVLTILVQGVAHGAPRYQSDPADCGLGYCVYHVDDGESNSLQGSTIGGDTAWLSMFHTNWSASSVDEITHVGSAYGVPYWPGIAPPNGTPVRVYVWDDPDNDGDPRTGPLVLVGEGHTEIANVDTDLVNFVRLTAPAVVQGAYFVGFVVSHAAGEFPAPADAPGPQNGCCFGWLTGHPVAGGFDPNDPAAFGIVPTCAVYMTRAVGLGSDASLYCAGDGTDAACPCGNESSPLVHGGCANSTGKGGSLSPWKSSSVAADDLRLVASNLVPGQPAMLFTGEQALNGGQGVPFGDGLRCVGGNVRRLGVKQVSPIGRAQWGPGLAATAGWSPGDVRHLQGWYRDPDGSPCGSGFNLTSAVELRVRP